MLHQSHLLDKIKKDRYRIPRPSALPIDPRNNKIFGLPPVVPYKHLPNPPDPGGNLMQRSLPYPTSDLITHPPIPPPSISPPPVEPNDDNFIKPPSDFTKNVLQEDFKRPMTRLINKKKNTVQVTPKKDTASEINEKICQIASLGFFPILMS